MNFWHHAHTPTVFMRGAIMPMCDYCGSSILFGGVRKGDLRFCNANCQQQGFVLIAADRVPADLLSQQVKGIHEGQCPKCKGGGPIDVHTSHIVWSALVLTSWRSRPQVCCKSCGTKAKIGAALSSAVLGWWGFPWGLLVTPVQIARNVGGLFSAPPPDRPSAELEKLVRVSIASRIIEEQQKQSTRS